MRGVSPDQSRHCRIGKVTFKPDHIQPGAYHKDFPDDAYWLRSDLTTWRRVTLLELVRNTR